MTSPLPVAEPPNPLRHRVPGRAHLHDVSDPDGGAGISVSLTLDATAAAGGTARRWVALELGRFEIASTDMRGDVELVVTELVTNAVRHGASPIVLTLTHAATELRVAVADGGWAPHQFDRLLHEPAAPRGRGLAIVALLAAAWGTWTQEPGPGKTVWCRLDTRPAVRDR